MEKQKLYEKGLENYSKAEVPSVHKFTTHILYFLYSFFLICLFSD